jgi:hypothetical protein
MKTRENYSTLSQADRTLFFRGPGAIVRGSDRDRTETTKE